MSLMRNGFQLLLSLKYYFSYCHHFSQTIILAETQISRKLLFLYAISDLLHPPGHQSRNKKERN